MSKDSSVASGPGFLWKVLIHSGGQRSARATNARARLSARPADQERQQPSIRSRFRLSEPRRPAKLIGRVGGYRKAFSAIWMPFGRRFPTSSLLPLVTVENEFFR